MQVNCVLAYQAYIVSKLTVKPYNKGAETLQEIEKKGTLYEMTIG